MIHASSDDAWPVQAGVTPSGVARRSGALPAGAAAMIAPSHQQPAADGRLAGRAGEAQCVRSRDHVGQHHTMAVLQRCEERQYLKHARQLTPSASATTLIVSAMAIQRGSLFIGFARDRLVDAATSDAIANRLGRIVSSEMPSSRQTAT
jgi:hypothetical protein